MKQQYTVKKITETIIKNKRIPEGETIYRLTAVNDLGLKVMLESSEPFSYNIEQFIYIEVTD